MKQIFALLISVLPMLALAQVEKVEELPGWGLFSLIDEDGPNAYALANNLSARVGTHLIYRAHAHRNLSFAQRETWIIDPAGNRRAEPDWGELHSLGNGQWLVQQQAPQETRLYTLDTQTLQRNMLFPNPSRLFGPPLNGRRLVVFGAGAQQSLWSADGTSGGNERLIDTVSITSTGTHPSDIQSLAGNWVFRTGDNKVYITDGSRAGTRLLREFNHGITIVGLRPQQAILHFNGALWGLRYEDGGLYHFFDFESQNIIGWGTAALRANLNGRVLFVLEVRHQGQAIWSTDGSFEGTHLLAPIPHNLGPPGQTGHYLLGDKVYYFCRNRYDTGGWETDGTPAGTRRIAHREAGLFFVTHGLVWGEDRALFAAHGLHQHSGLWMLAEGQLQDVTPWPGYGAGLRHVEPSHIPLTLLRAGEQHVYFQASGIGVGRELHRIGRDGRTELVADLSPGAAWSHVVPLGQAGPWFYFVLNHPGGGASLYRVRDDQPLPPRAAASTPYEWQQGLFSIWRHGPSSPAAISLGLVCAEGGSVYSTGVYNSFYGLAATNSRQTTQPDEDLMPSSPSSPHNSYFLAKMNAEDGQVAWLETLAPSSTPSASRAALAAAPGQGVYFAGSSTSTHARALLMRIDSSGQERWRLHGSIGTQSHSLGTDAEGNLLALLWLRDNEATLEGAAFDNPHRLSTTGSRWGLAKIRPDGSIAWAQQLARSEAGKQENSINALAIGPQGQIYLAYTLINAPGSRNDCGDEGISSQIQLACLMPDGQLLWDRTLNQHGAAVPTGLALNRQGLLLLSGFATDDLHLGPFHIEGKCAYWHSFVLMLSAEGQPLTLNRLEGDEPVAYAIAANESGGYAVAGMLGYYPIHIPYPGLAGKLPYGTNQFRQIFVRHYSEQHQLLDEKRWYQVFNRQGPAPVGQNLIRMTHLRDSEFVFQHPYSGPLDTFAHSPMLSSIGSMVMRLSMDEPPPPPLIEEGELQMSQVTVFPNPARQVLTLHSDHADFKTAPFYLFNSLGQPVSIPDIAAFGPYRYLDVSKLPPGVYFLGIRQGKAWETVRVVVQR